MRRVAGQAAQENSDVDSPVFPSYSMPKALIRDRLACDRELRARWVEHALESNRLAGLDAEGDDVLDFEVDPSPIPDAVTHAVVDDLDRCALDSEHLSDEWGETCHRTTSWPRRPP
jgi:hypothetical protein